MTLLMDVVDFIEDAGREVTADEAIAHLSHYTRRQVMDAVHKACRVGLAKCTRNTYDGSRRVGHFVYVEKHRRSEGPIGPRYASVFHYAQGVCA